MYNLIIKVVFWDFFSIFVSSISFSSPSKILKKPHLTKQHSKGSNQAQVDMVIDRADRAVTVCEMKFSERPYVITKSEWDKIEERLNVVQQHFKRKTLFFAMVTTNGLAKNKYSINYVQQEITLDDFFWFIFGYKAIKICSNSQK